MKINYVFGKSAVSTIMENFRRVMQGRVSQNQVGHTPVYGSGMYGLLVKSGHEQDTRR